MTVQRKHHLTCGGQWGHRPPHFYLPVCAGLRWKMKTKHSKLWYWLTVLSLFLVMMFNCGVGYYSLSLFVMPITRTFGISSGDFAVVYVFYGIGSAAAAMSLYKLLKRISLKQMIIFGGLISMVGYILFSGAHSLVYLFAGGILIGASTVFSGTAAVQLVIARWFSDRRSQITGLVASASGIGTAIGSPFVGWVIRSVGWRTACFMIGGLVAIFVCVQAVFLLRDDPGHVGLQPYTLGHKNENVSDDPDLEEGGIALQEGMRRPYFWLFFGGMIVVAVVYQIISLYQSTILIERGFSEELAAACLSVFAVVDTCCKASAGMIADRFGFRLVTLYCAVCTASAFIAVRVVNGTPGAILFSALLGFWPTICVLYGVTASISLFGKKHLSEYIGFTQTLMCCCSLVGMPAVRHLYNTVGTFGGIMNIAIGFLMVFCLMMVLMLRKKNLFGMELAEPANMEKEKT